VAELPNDTSVVVRGAATGFAQEISVRSHRLRGDEPTASGGTDTGPSPYDLLLAALASTAPRLSSTVWRPGRGADRRSNNLRLSANVELGALTSGNPAQLQAKSQIAMTRRV